MTLTCHFYGMMGLFWVFYLRLCLPVFTTTYYQKTVLLKNHTGSNLPLALGLNNTYCLKKYAVQHMLYFLEFECTARRWNKWYFTKSKNLFWFEFRLFLLLLKKFDG